MAVTPEIIESPPKKASFIKPLILILGLICLVILAKVGHLQDYLQEDRLRDFIASYGLWGPLIYLVIWTIAPTLLFPGLVLTLVGGVLFGPVLGVVYTTIGATLGASLAFLVSRYLARDWVEAKIRGTRLSHLDEKVLLHGWKIVAFTRVIGIPYILLNYAYGLTRISLVPYALATCFAMLPWTIGLVLVSSNLLGLLQGKVSIWLIIGGVLVGLVALIPVFYKKLRARQRGAAEI